MSTPTFRAAGANVPYIRAFPGEDSYVRWSIVVPVKRRAYAKTRLKSAVPATAHANLVAAITYDTVSAILASPPVARVLVVTDDEVLRTGVELLGAHCVPDTPDAGLNPALTYGARIVADWDEGAGIVALGSDRPALRPTELAAALLAAESVPRAVVPDTEGSGTALLTARPGVDLAPAFGPGSAAAHTASGAVALVGDWPTLRRDTDTAADLTAAARLGLGPRTSALLTTLRAS